MAAHPTHLALRPRAAVSRVRGARERTRARRCDPRRPSRAAHSRSARGGGGSRAAPPVPAPPWRGARRWRAVGEPRSAARLAAVTYLGPRAPLSPHPPRTARAANNEAVTSHPPPPAPSPSASLPSDLAPLSRPRPLVRRASAVHKVAGLLCGSPPRPPPRPPPHPLPPPHRLRASRPAPPPPPPPRRPAPPRSRCRLPPP